MAVGFKGVPHGKLSTIGAGERVSVPMEPLSPDVEQFFRGSAPFNKE